MTMKMKHDMKAILGEDFFKEEVKCDYSISEAQKMIWAMEMDLYLVFVEICQKYDLQYFVMYGSLLGAVRHNGFIPWDDDIDVGMPRKDYDTFIKVAPKEWSEPYALQCPYTYPNCYITNITLRNEMGTFTPKVFKTLDYNKGIPLDVFPFDYCDPNTASQERERIFEHIMKCASWMKMQCTDLAEDQKNTCLKYKTDSPLYHWEMIQRIASNPDYIGSDYMTMVVQIPNIKRNPCIYRTEWFASTVMHKFETIEVPVPIGWDGTLTTYYGPDYMQFPPIEARGAINDKIIVDPFTPYKRKFSMLK